MSVNAFLDSRNGIYQRGVAFSFIILPIMANSLSVAGSNSRHKEPGANSAGFLIGLWHGIIAPITFLVNLFALGVSIYETNNNGRWYEFGFMPGIGAYAGNGEVRQAARG